MIKKGIQKLATLCARRIIKDRIGQVQTEIAPGTKVYELAKFLMKEGNKME